jgi:phage major head subunit gpT-like protein
MTVATGNFAELLWPGIKKLFGDRYKDYPVVYPQVFKVEKSTQTFEKIQGVTGLPLAAIKEQGAGISYADMVQGYQKEFVHVTYGLGSSVTREMWEDDQYRYINSVPRRLARAMRVTEETVHADILNNAFTTETVADGLSIINSAHINAATGTTQSNQPATASDLSQTALEQAFIDIRQFTDDQDILISVKPAKLLVPNEEMFRAEKILGTRQEVESADNTINPMYKKIPLIVWDYLTDPDAWFILTDQDMEGLLSLTRRDTEADRDNEFDTQNLKFITTRRWSAGCADWRCIYGTAGA